MFLLWVVFGIFRLVSSPFRLVCLTSDQKHPAQHLSTLALSMNKALLADVALRILGVLTAAILILNGILCFSLCHNYGPSDRTDVPSKGHSLYIRDATVSLVLL